jgi:hypothetical protein
MNGKRVCNILYSPSLHVNRRVSLQLDYEISSLEGGDRRHLGFLLSMFIM